MSFSTLYKVCLPLVAATAAATSVNAASEGQIEARDFSGQYRCHFEKGEFPAYDVTIKQNRTRLPMKFRVTTQHAGSEPTVLNLRVKTTDPAELCQITPGDRSCHHGALVSEDLVLIKYNWNDMVGERWYQLDTQGNLIITDRRATDDLVSICPPVDPTPQPQPQPMPPPPPPDQMPEEPV